jgi:hypothetical protein
MQVKYKNLFVFAVYALIIVRIAWTCYEKAAYNWDTLPYIAIILNADDEDLASVHRKTYAAAQAEIPEQFYQRMVDTTHVLRKTVLNDVTKFFQYTSFFRIKPLYNAFSYAAYKAGIPLTKAPIIPSVFSFLAIAMIIPFWLNKFFAFWLAVVTSLCIMVSPPILEIARLATPDGFGTLVLLIAIFAIKEQVAWYWVTLLLTISILIRVDNILFAVIASAFQAFTLLGSDKSKLPGTAFGMLVLLWGFYAFWIMYSSNFENGFANFYGGLSKKGNPITVITDAATGFNTLQTSYLTVLLAICSIVLFYKTNTGLSFNPAQYVFLMLMVYFVVRFVLFPDLTTRFFLFLYIALILLSLESISARLSAKPTE